MITSIDNIIIEPTTQSRIHEVNFNDLDFGKHISDHMLVIDYSNGKWGTPKIIPYGNLMLSPAMLSLHYGQAIFEGMKAFKMKDGRINIFRPYKHHQRMLKSLDRMCMPPIPEQLFIQALSALITHDHQWIPTTNGASLYIRPVVFASEPKLGVKISDEYKFIIMTTPVGVYLNKPYFLKVENYYVRTSEGGTGFAKCAGNYGGAFYPTQIAKQQGYDQILWTDYKNHEYIDEVGMMNVMFIINEKLVTPQLNTAILEGITRDSILTLAKDMGIHIEERKISVKELADGLQSGVVTEIFGTGTAAVVAPVERINIEGREFTIPLPTADSFQNRVKEKLINIRLGTAPDIHNWNYILP